jgi:hypothetical protein
MATKSPEKDLTCGDDAKRDQVLKKLFGTPPQPKSEPKAAPKPGCK